MRLRVEGTHDVGKMRGQAGLALLEQLERAIHAAAVACTTHALRPKTRSGVRVDQFGNVDSLKNKGYTHITASLLAAAYLVPIELN